MGNEKRLREDVEDFLRNPFTITVLSLAVATVVSLFNKFYAAVGLWVIAIVLSAVSLTYGLYKQKFSVEELEKENKDLKSARDTLKDEKEDLEKQVKQQPKLIRYKKATTTVEIRNTNGDAKFSYTDEIANLGDKCLTSLKQEIYWVGEPLDCQKVPGYINDNPVDVRVTESSKHDTASGALTGRKAELKCYLVEPIEPGKTFLYDFEFELKGVFKDAFNGRDSYNRSFYFPTDRFEMVIKAPDNYNFVPDLDVSVQNYYSTEDDLERDRVKTLHRPTLNNQRKIVKWRVKEPIMTYRYTITFGLEKKEKTEAGYTGDKEDKDVEE